MEDLQVIIYIVFGIIYLIFGALKKRRQGQNTTPPLFEDEEAEVPGRSNPERRRHVEAMPQEQPQEPGSIEELLERYEEAANRAKRRAAAKAAPAQEQADAEFKPSVSDQPTYRNLEQEALEQMQRTEHLKSVQESLPAKARAEVLSRQPSAIAPPTRTVRSVAPSRKRQTPRKRAVYKPMPQAQQIRNLLQSKTGIRQAIILTEVLNRKHF